MWDLDALVRSCGLDNRSGSALTYVVVVSADQVESGEMSGEKSRQGNQGIVL